MDQSINFKENLIKFLSGPLGAGASGALHNMAEAIAAKEDNAEQSAVITQVPVNDLAGCGNGYCGNGAPGERQVNNAGQDIDAPPTNITQSETSVAAHGPFLLFGFNDSNGFAVNNGSGFAFSSDGGITWTDCGDLPLNPGWFNGGDPVTAVDKRGVFYYSQISADNNGVSNISISTGTVNKNTRLLAMNNPFVAGVTSGSTARFQDKEWMTVGRDALGGPNDEAIYVTWTDFPDSDPNPNINIRFSKWTTGVNPVNLIASQNIVTAAAVTGSYPVVDKDGNIYVFYEDFLGNFIGINKEIRMVRSTNGGQTFSIPITVSAVTRAGTITTCGPNQRSAIVVTNTKVIRLREFPSAAIGPDGTIYVVWNDGRDNATEGINIYLAYSQDQGTTWTVRQVTNGVTDEFMPSVTADCRGAHIQYSKFGGTTVGTGNGRFALFMKSFTVDGGVGPETMVSTVFSLVPDTRPNFDNQIASCYMGDYNQIISGPGNVLYHAWGDNRHDPVNGNNPDVFFIQTGRSNKDDCCCPKFIKYKFVGSGVTVINNNESCPQTGSGC